jgi:hypothetical protein
VRRPKFGSDVRYRTQTPFTSFIPVAHRTACRRAAVRTQTPLTRCMPAPQASRTVVTKLSGFWTAASGIAYADDPIATTKATATSLIMNSSKHTKRALCARNLQSNSLTKGRKLDLGPTRHCCMKWLAMPSTNKPMPIISAISQRRTFGSMFCPARECTTRAEVPCIRP